MDPICRQNVEKEIEMYRENKVQQDHRNDCLILLSYSILLILSVITIWIFKHKRLKFVHETGFALIFGIILGIIFYNTNNTSIITTNTVSLPQNSNQNCNTLIPPDYLIVQMNITDENMINKAISISYNYQHILKSNDTISKQLGAKATFNAEIFFNLLLPPIIFCAGYNMKKKHFFENLGAIITFAFMGTILSSFTIGGICYGLSKAIPNFTPMISFQDCLVFGAFISATDPVTVLAIFNDLSVEVDLYALVFGESVLNDAVAIVLAESVENYGSSNAGGVFSMMELLLSIKLFITVFLGALGIGCLVGIITAILTKYTYIRDHPLLETALFFLMSYCSFLGAEAAGLSGIVASLFCGITQAHYTFNNLSDVSQRWTKEIFELLSFLSENFVFVYIGLSTITFREQLWSAKFIVIALFSVVVGRAVNVYTLSALLNLGRTNRIGFHYQHMMMFAGLRGAMAFALAIRNTSTPARQMFFSTTLIIVTVTVFVCGGLTKFMIKWLNIRMGKDADIASQTPEPINDTTEMPNVFLDAMERHKKKAVLIRMFAQLDCKFIKPLLTHSAPPLTESCSDCCLPLSRILTTDEQMTQTDLSTPNHSHTSSNGAQHHYMMHLKQPDTTGVISDNKNVSPATGDNPGFRPDSSASSHKQSQHHRRNSDLDLILSDNDDDQLQGYIEADESRLYIQSEPQTDKI